MTHFSLPLLRSLGLVLIALLSIINHNEIGVLAYEDQLWESYPSRCSGMWGPNQGVGNGDSMISLTFTELWTATDVAVLIFHYKDQDMALSSTTVVMQDATMNAPIYQERKSFTSLNDTKNFHPEYHIKSTGLYCVAVKALTPGASKNLTAPFYDLPISNTAVFTVTVKYQNPYGLLPASDYPKLPFFGLLSIVYLIFGILWFVRAWMSWRDLLMLQHYVTAVIFFLVVEMAFNYGFFENYNVNGAPNLPLLIIMVVLSAARNSISFYMLLIVALGYGVVRPTLGTNMYKCLALAGAHFVFGVLYGIGSLMISDVTTTLALVFAFPLSAAMTAFYFFTLHGLRNTMEVLELRRQGVKVTMYRRLWKILFSSFIALLAFFITNMLIFSLRSRPSWAPILWQWKWFLIDGWLNILYLIVFMSIAYLWRPTDNNQRYGLDELASEDWDDELEAAVTTVHGAQAAVAPGGGIKLQNIAGATQDGSAEDTEDDEEADEDLFKWAEDNAGGAHQENGTEPGMERDMSDAVLLKLEDEGHSHDKRA